MTHASSLARLTHLLADSLTLLAAGRYTGGLDDVGRYDGVGQLIAANGDIYRGDFHHGTFHGTGSYVFKKGGGSYTGHFREGLFAGTESPRTPATRQHTDRRHTDASTNVQLNTIAITSDECRAPSWLRMLLLTVAAARLDRCSCWFCR